MHNEFVFNCVKDSFVRLNMAASGIINIKTKVDDTDNKKKQVLFAVQVYRYYNVFILAP